MSSSIDSHRRKRRSSVGTKKSLAILTCCCVLSFAWLAPARAAYTQTLRGFAPDAVAREMEYEQIVNDSPSAAAALRYERGLSTQAHPRAHPADIAPPCICATGLPLTVGRRTSSPTSCPPPGRRNSHWNSSRPIIASSTCTNLLCPGILGQPITPL